MLGQLGFYAVRSFEKGPLAIERFTTESGRLLGVVEARVREAPYPGGEDHSSADIACHGRPMAATTLLTQALGDKLDGNEAIHAGLDKVGARPGVQRGMAVPRS